MKNIDFYYHQIVEILVILAIVFIAFKCIDLFRKNFKEKLIKKHEDITILSFFPLIDKVLKFTVLFLALATYLQSNGYSITSLIAGFGVTGLAVSFGAQSTISNIFGSFSLLADKAYKVGDYIIINQAIAGNNVEGIVEDINLRSTKLRCEDGGLLIIPNNIVATGVVKNTVSKI